MIWTMRSCRPMVWMTSPCSPARSSGRASPVAVGEGEWNEVAAFRGGLFARGAAALVLELLHPAHGGVDGLVV